MIYREGENEKSPVWFLDVRDTDFSPDSAVWQERINAEIRTILTHYDESQWAEPVLIKCHIGEKNCRTRMLPEYCISTVDHFKSRGMKRVACGDTTVAYTGERGYHDNHKDCSPYFWLAERHGWTEKGPLGTPFIILDKPATSREGHWTFETEEVVHQTAQYTRFKDVYLAGGFAEAGTIVNHVHLTLHDMAQVACAVKGITMGGSSYRGKLVMHKCYSPVIDDKACTRCGTCASKCPEGALIWGRGLRQHTEYVLDFSHRFGQIDWAKGSIPHLEKDRCIGCGECVAVCHGKGISMDSSEIDDWLRGGSSLPYRMTDYILGMMEGRWERLLNIVHLYNITRRCDCVDEVQTPIVPHIGFVIGRNPFAVDLMSTYLLHEEVYKEYKRDDGIHKHAAGLDKSEILKIFFAEYHGMDPYKRIEHEYGIVVEPDPKHVRIS
jgi:uncharacterized Fe-S center protein